jgi:hypothetical protein
MVDQINSVVRRGERDRETERRKGRKGSNKPPNRVHPNDY